MADLRQKLSGKIESNKTAIGFIEPETQKAQEEIELFSPYVAKTDEEILVILDEINDLKNQIVTLSENAYAVGCGTTGGAEDVYEDVVDITVENMEEESYVEDEPFGHIVTKLNSDKIGIGSIMVHVPDDSTAIGFGTLFAQIDTCFSPGLGCAVPGTCDEYNSSIAALQSQIVTLRNKLPTPIEKSNSLKKERRNSHISRYGTKKGSKTLEDRNTEIESAIQTIDSF